ncbi:DUF2463 domain-containing protein [Encephalitozoon hellem]|nr:DUF2463 domain-containing protein [Encephalitozoon hellem]
MNAHAQQPHPSDLNTHTNTPGVHPTSFLSQYAPFISILLPTVSYILFKHDFKSSILIRLITILLPCLYNSIQHLLLFHSILSTETQHILHSIFKFIIASILLLLSSIPLLQILLISFGKSIDYPHFFLILPSLLVLPPYLLSTTLEPTHPLNPAISLLALITIYSYYNQQTYYPYIAATSPILILVASYKHTSSQHKRTDLSKTVLFLLISAAACIIIFKDSFHQIQTRLNSNPDYRNIQENYIQPLLKLTAPTP